MSSTILFVDDHNILYRSGTRRVLNSPIRHDANPLITPDRPWETAIAWTSVCRNYLTGKYQLWYQSFAGDRADNSTHRCVVCYAESDDGIHFIKPNLNLFNFNKIKDTNIVLVGNGGHSLRYANSVIIDSKEKDPNRRYKMAYFDFAQDKKNEYPGLCVAFSADGIRWEKYSRAPLLKSSYGSYGQAVPFDSDLDQPWDVPLSMSDAVDVIYDPRRKVYALYGKMWIDGPDGGMYWKHGMGRTESENFVDWKTPELLCVPDESDPAHVEFHTSPVFFYQDVYFCLNQILNRDVQGGVIDIELGISRDGINWHRPFRSHFFLSRSGHDQFDGGSIFTNSTPVILDDEIRFYYGGYSQGTTGADDYNHVSGVGLAVLQRDRFAGLTPVSLSDQSTLRKPLQNIGQITLKPIILATWDQIFLNADASCGTVWVELLDQYGRRVKGFSKAEAVPVQGDSLRHKIRWRDCKLTDLDGGAYLLRLHLDAATVYALTLVSES